MPRRARNYRVVAWSPEHQWEGGLIGANTRRSAIRFMRRQYERLRAREGWERTADDYTWTATYVPWGKEEAYPLMAWEIVRYICGHEERIQADGTPAMREKRRIWAAQRLCNPCKRAADVSAAGDEAHRLRLPPLIGTQDEVARALTIRREKLTNLNDYLYDWERWVRHGRQKGELAGKENEIHEFRTMLHQLIALIAKRDTAAWWISMKHAMSKDLLLWAKERYDAGRASGLV